MTSFGIKMLGMITMVIDHLGFMFFPDKIIYRLIGRIAFPLFAFQLAIGYSHSKNKEKHIGKMLLFSILSQIPFYIFSNLANPTVGHLLNVGFTFTFGLVGMYAIEKFKNPIIKFLGIIWALLLGLFIPVDYGVFGVALCVIFYLFLSSKILTIISSASVICCKILIEKLLWSIPSLYALIPIGFYNGKKGKDTKWLFYVFYPLHMIIFSIIYLNI